MFKRDGLLKGNTESHSPHSLIPKLIRKNSLVLDVGCNTGLLAHKLKDKSVTLDGVDINDEALKMAQKYYRRVFKRDLYIPSLQLPLTKYDYIVYSDVLEHLPYPDKLLIDTRKYVKKDGFIIASIPNVARFEIRLQLLLGRFRYEESGIMSSDHLRFFTKDSAIKMFEESGYSVIKVIPTGLGHIIKVFPTFTAFQFIYVCKLRDL